MKNQFRFNIVDDRGTTSFVGPAHGLKIIAAACGKGMETARDVLEVAHAYDATWASWVQTGLNVFDEHNISRVSGEFEPLIFSEDDEAHQPFRVLDQETRQRSMQPARLGLIVFNLKEKRMIQLQNQYGEFTRQGRGRIRADGKPTRMLFHYELPPAWSIVP